MLFVIILYHFCRGVYYFRSCAKRTEEYSMHRFLFETVSAWYTKKLILKDRQATALFVLISRFYLLLGSYCQKRQKRTIYFCIFFFKENCFLVFLSLLALTERFDQCGARWRFPCPRGSKNPTWHMLAIRTLSVHFCVIYLFRARWRVENEKSHRLSESRQFFAQTKQILCSKSCFKFLWVLVSCGCSCSGSTRR